MFSHIVKANIAYLFLNRAFHLDIWNGGNGPSKRGMGDDAVSICQSTGLSSLKSFQGELNRPYSPPLSESN